MIRRAEISDSKSIADIYNFYIETSAATFEETPLDISEMENRITKIQTEFPFIVYEENGEILGYAYLNYFRPRSAYRFTLEDSIYLRNGYQGKGIGKKLLKELLAEIQQRDIHAIIAVITVPNEASIALHEAFGFKKAGILNEVGKKFDKWQDVGYWELILDFSYD